MPNGSFQMMTVMVFLFVFKKKTIIIIIEI